MSVAGIVPSPTERIVYMKHHVHNIILFLVTLSFLFTGCTASTIGLKMADQIKEHTSSSTDSLPPQDVTPSEPAETDDNTSLPITFSVSHAGDGALGVSVNQVRVIRQLEELPSTDGFIDSFASAYAKETISMSPRCPDRSGQPRFKSD